MIVASWYPPLYNGLHLSVGQNKWFASNEQNMVKVMDAISEIRRQKDRYFHLALFLVLMEASCNVVSWPVERAGGMKLREASGQQHQGPKACQ